MARIPVAIISAEQVSDSVETVYTAPTNKKTIIRKITATNTTTNTPSLTLHFVPSGDTAADDTTLIKDLVFSSSEQKTLELEGQVLESGTTIQVISSAANEITLYASGIEVIV